MNVFKKEIIFVLLLKTMLIYSLWFVFFSSPIDKTLTDDSVSAALFGVTAGVGNEKEKIGD